MNSKFKKFILTSFLFILEAIFFYFQTVGMFYLFVLSFFTAMVLLGLSPEGLNLVDIQLIDVNDFKTDHGRYWTMGLLYFIPGTLCGRWLNDQRYQIIDDEEKEFIFFKR